MINERKNNDNDVMVVQFVSSFSHTIYPETSTEMDVNKFSMDCTLIDQRNDAGKMFKTLQWNFTWVLNMLTLCLLSIRV